MKPIGVKRNPVRSDVRPWFVLCALCDGSPEGDFLSVLFSPPLGWARTWRAAQDFATKHAIEHEKTRCTSCLHMPAQRLPEGATP